MRAIISVVLMCVAGLAAVAGCAAQWVDLAARTPTPTRQIVGPVVTDPEVLASLSATLAAEIQQRVPSSVEAVPQLEEQLNELISTAAEATLADPRIDRAWLATIDATRAGVVADLDLVHAGELEDPTLWLDLTPFTALAKEQAYAATPERLHRFLDEIEWPAELRVPLAHPDPHYSKLAAEVVTLSAGWVWCYVAAGLAALLGFLVGGRRSRWVAVALGGVVAAGVILFGHRVLGQVSVAEGDTIGRTVAASLANGTANALIDWTMPALYASAAAVALGVLGVIVASFSRR